MVWKYHSCPIIGVFEEHCKRSHLVRSEFSGYLSALSIFLQIRARANGTTYLSKMTHAVGLFFGFFPPGSES